MLRFLWEDKYEDYFKKNFPKNKNIYKGLNQEQVNAIKYFFRWVTRLEFNRANKEVLVVSPSKKQKLIELMGDVSDWYYDGMYDLGDMIGKCTLGHTLRYEHYAYSPSTQRTIVFGYKCVGDFFEVSDKLIRRLDGLRKQTGEEVKRILYVQYNQLNKEYFEKTCSPYLGNLNNPEYMKGFMQYCYELDKENTCVGIIKMFIQAGLPVPMVLIDRLSEFDYKYRKQQEKKAFLSQLNEKELYALEQVSSDNFKDYKIASRLRIAMSTQAYKDVPDMVLGLIQLFSLVVQHHNLIKEVDKFAKAIDFFAYDTAYYKRDNNKLRPAYADEIMNDTVEKKNLYVLDFSSFKHLMVIRFITDGEREALKYCITGDYKSYQVLHSYKTMVDLRVPFQQALRYLKNHDLFEEIDQYNLYKQDVLKINKTVSGKVVIKEEQAEDYNKRADTEDTITHTQEEEAWNYLKKNKDRVTYGVALSILGRYKSVDDLSEKQAKVIVDIYNSMTGNKKVKALGEPRELRKTNEVERLLVLADNEQKCYAVIGLNDSCKIIVARKLMATDTAGIAEIYARLTGEKVIVYQGVDVPNHLTRVRKLLGNNFKGRVKVQDISKIIGKSYVTSGDLGFTEEQLKDFAYKVFTEEGHIDNFLVEATAKLLNYRKVVKQHHQQN